MGNLWLKFLILLCIGQIAAADVTNQRSVYQVFQDAVAIADRGKVPVVFLDLDDTLIRTVFRYLDVMEALNAKFEIFPPWSKPGSKDWRASHHMRPEDIVYADSFEKTLRLTLEKLITAPDVLERMYRPNARGTPEALQTFFDTFFDPSRVGKDAMFQGSVYFLNNLLSLMRALKGKVVFLSGRADKYLEVTKNALVHNGVSPSLLAGPHVLWYLKPSSGKISFSEDVRLDFRNDKAGMVTSVLEADPRLEVAGFVDNEARNVFSLVGHDRVGADRLYFFRSVDATWSAPADGNVVGGFLDRIRGSRDHFTQFETYRTTPHQAIGLKALLMSHGAEYVSNVVRPRQPKVASCRQLTIYNAHDCQTLLDIVCP